MGSCCFKKLGFGKFETFLPFPKSVCLLLNFEIGFGEFVTFSPYLSFNN
jgi:hypothetical protein